MDITTQEQFQRGEWSLVEEIKQYSPLLWREHWIVYESTRDFLSRKAAEKAVCSDIIALSWPYSNGPKASAESYFEMPSRWLRKCNYIFTVLQHHVRGRDIRAIGLFLWGASIWAMLSGSKALMTILNRLGVTVSYDTMQRVRNSVAKQEISLPLKEKVISTLMAKVAWDNIDSAVLPTCFALLGKN